MKDLWKNSISQPSFSKFIELGLLGTFALFFAGWLLIILPTFGDNQINLLITLLVLGVWFSFTETKKQQADFKNEKTSNNLLIADTLVFGAMFIYLTYLFGINKSLDSTDINFILYLPAVSIPLYYSFKPGLISLSSIYFGYFLVTILLTSNPTHGIAVALLHILSYLVVYTLISVTISKKEKANTELKKALAKVETLDKAKDNFISIAAHELKGPATIICGYAEILKFDKLDKEKFAEVVNHIYAGSNDLAQLTKRLLDYNRIQMGKLTINSSPFPASIMCKEIIQDYNITNSNKNVEYFFKAECSNDTTGECPLVDAFGDKELIKEVIINLLNNSKKFTEKGDITLGLNKTEKETIFSAKDSGTGMSMEDTEKVFRKFYQGKEGQANHLGLGLGLNISKEIINAHGGKIWLDSKLGEGTTFFFSIPN